jgi:protein gp37
MGEKWWDHSFNPWLGCDKVSPACKNCYAEAGAKRFGQAEWGPEATRQIVGDSTWKRPIKWNREAEEKRIRARVFCASWADVFEDRPELDAPRARLFALIERTPHLDWLLTTKRPQNIARMIPCSWRGAMPHNVWLGTTTENQKYANERIPHLIACRAVVTFVSVEPQLGPIRPLSLPRAARLGHLRRRERKSRQTYTSRVGALDSRSVRNGWRQLLLQAVGPVRADWL